MTLTAKTITPRASGDYGEVRWDAVVTNQHDAQGCRIRRAHTGGQVMTYRIAVCYRHPDDPAAFDDHYRPTRIPLAREVPGLSA